MSKIMKIAYFAMMAITGIFFIWNIVVSEWKDAVMMGSTLSWLFITYSLFRINDDSISELDILVKELTESHIRVKIAAQELAKMRERAQNAEKQLQQMIDDTPARGEDGRFVKRDN